MTLVILAAGMGSRYGGLKQIDPITAEGEFIIDFRSTMHLLRALIRSFLLLNAKILSFSVKR